MSIVQKAHAVEETTIVVIGRASAITTGFASAVEAAGWRWEEMPDTPTLFARPLPPRAVVALPVPVFIPAASAMIRLLTAALALPVVVFSAECRPEIINSALQAGADDFVPIPVTVEEMIARLAAVIRVRFGAHGEQSRSDYRLDEAAHVVTITDGGEVRLSVSEYRLLRMLLAARNRPVARERLAAVPLPQAEGAEQNALDAAMSRLRRKLGADRIVTIRGIGYQLVDHRQPPDNLSFLHDARAARKQEGASAGNACDSQHATGRQADGFVGNRCPATPILNEF